MDQGINHKRGFQGSKQEKIHNNKTSNPYKKARASSLPRKGGINPRTAGSSFRASPGVNGNDGDAGRRRGKEERRSRQPRRPNSGWIWIEALFGGGERRQP